MKYQVSFHIKKVTSHVKITCLDMSKDYHYYSYMIHSPFVAKSELASHEKR